ncbi:MAG: phytanoyl-CoA dioxygenase family protein [Bryobacteraceae bacterium]
MGSTARVAIAGLRIAGSEELGTLGVRHLKRLWSRTMSLRARPGPDAAAEEWDADNTLLCGLGLGLHETLHYLYKEAPAFERFEQWVLKNNGGAINPGRIARINAALSGTLPQHGDPGAPVLTPQDLAFFEEHGYVVLHDAVAPEACAAAAGAIWEFVGAHPDRPDTWYSGPQGHSIWVPLLRHPALEAARTSPRIFTAFAQLWGRTDLWANIDQAGFNPPERPGWRFPGPLLHFDMSLELPIHFGLQGILYLTGTAAGQGAFTCVPGFHRKIEDWLRSLPPDTDPRQQDLHPFGPVPIPGQAGDLILWHHALPHGSSPNHASRPRIVQYIALRPTTWTHAAKWR